ncbi:Gfo/Idh/MocA family oxidoreductase [Pseudomonas sp. CBSPBW29]|uniref:Gfo/Idh/MocA family protein n=1 Tax=Pseudomonas sp. CBS TaxID=2971912 RepID=UPI0021AD10A8|nr:Gfo/Idh/MocA family oxidoreductase [Pseudomonas sp. CBS]WEL43541.1 Gfo/Idh/MocA family oxidoreductase [Pseudomonas sp. CBSPBW29]WEL68078.1 Gfo/Idh/MocA family oxidoreductase [Pseudomonas sp. CBSPCGW29]WEL75102.1 Gfo/Idh/MocA family oxidoreductase [Pseudomonas sp. CBSPAW29]WEL80653.1 Gfo/Idh/MocA family oxidoreductase [Pseudomonas sp. CBSPCAW29]UVH51823.1 Gfo/Idh/MocA family oxidoreductase [Pseudomonas sp. CBS]
MSQKITEAKPLGVACLGITHPHTSGRVKAFQRMANVRFLGAYDDSPLLEPFVDALGLHARTKEEILADPDVHIVLVHPKSYLMADWALEALEAGKAVLCEKPAGRGSKDTQRIVDAVERTGNLFQVGYCWRFAPSVEKMQQVLQSGELGKVLQVRAHAGCSHDEADTNHMKQPGDLGGAFYVIGCHTIDRILLHFGMPRSVNARITKFAGQMSESAREDAAAAVLNYDDKMVTIDFTSWDPMPWTEAWDITAYGTHGVMHSTPMPASYKLYHDGKNGHPQGWTHWNETSFPEIWAVRKTVYSPEIAEIGNPVYFDREATAFVQALLNGTPSQVPASQAHNINLILEALFESASLSGQEVKLG